MNSHVNSGTLTLSGFLPCPNLENSQILKVMIFECLPAKQVIPEIKPHFDAGTRNGRNKSME